MTATRDLGNKRVTLLLGAANAIADLSQPSIAECAAMLNVTPAVRWDGYDLGMQESEDVDDRSLADDAGAVLPGFIQFGGGLPIFLPKKTDSTSILRTTYNLVKVPRTELVAVERIGFQDYSTAIAAGDNVNTYKLMADGYKPDTEGDGGYAALLNLIARGTAYPWTIVPAASPVALAIGGSNTQTIAVGARFLRPVTYQSNNVANRCTYVISDTTKLKQVGPGIFEGVATGSATVKAQFPGATDSPVVTVTVS